MRGMMPLIQNKKALTDALEKVRKIIMSLRVKINILITLLMLVFIGSTTAIQLRDAKQQIQEEITAGTKVANQLLPYFLARAQLLSQGKDREDALKKLFKKSWKNQST